MRDSENAPEGSYQPETVMAHVSHLSPRAQAEIEQIARIVRSTFGHGADVEDCRILRITLTAPKSVPDEATGYVFAVKVSSRECAGDEHLDFARRAISAEIGPDRSVTLAITAARAGKHPEGITLYDAASDSPLNARERPRLPVSKNLH